MKRIRLRRAGGARAPRPSTGAGYSVGYGKPPKQHQFRRGRSGNPKGRPKGVKNTLTLLREILDRQVEIRTGSLVRKISVREAVLTRFAESALKGDIKAACQRATLWTAPSISYSSTGDTFTSFSRRDPPFIPSSRTS